MVVFVVFRPKSRFFYPYSSTDIAPPDGGRPMATIKMRSGGYSWRVVVVVGGRHRDSDVANMRSRVEEEEEEEGFEVFC